MIKGFAMDDEGITPIYMGSTTIIVNVVLFHQDHPHIHGEHMIAKEAEDNKPGSPPYTWGAPSDGEVVSGVVGITPIYMGSTLRRGSAFDSGGDHPHIHGEHRQSTKSASRLIGSPPYTWGARHGNLWDGS